MNADGPRLFPIVFKHDREFVYLGADMLMSKEKFIRLLRFAFEKMNETVQAKWKRRRRRGK